MRHIDILIDAFIHSLGSYFIYNIPVAFLSVRYKNTFTKLYLLIRRQKTAVEQKKVHVAKGETINWFIEPYLSFIGETFYMQKIRP